MQDVWEVKSQNYYIDAGFDFPWDIRLLCIQFLNIFLAINIFFWHYDVNTLFSISVFDLLSSLIKLTVYVFIHADIDFEL